MNRAASEALEASIARRLASRKTDGWTAAQVRTFADKFQREFGLAAEAAGLLDLLVPAGQA